MAAEIYSTPLWRAVRVQALARDRHRCTVSRLLGGSCSAGPLHVHHIVPVNEGGADQLDNVATVCSRHHPVWEALRRAIVRRNGELEVPRCPHQHRTREARELCEARMARRSMAA